MQKITNRKRVLIPGAGFLGAHLCGLRDLIEDALAPITYRQTCKVVFPRFKRFLVFFQRAPAECTTNIVSLNDRQTIVQKRAPRRALDNGNDPKVQGLPGSVAIDAVAGLCFDEQLVAVGNQLGDRRGG